MIDTLFAAADWLRATNNQGYGTLPIPQPRDRQIDELLRIWMKLQISERQQSSHGIAEDQRFVLLAYSERTANLAVRERNPELITLGLLALGIDGWRGDWRDNAALLSLHYDAGQRIGADVNLLFKEAAALLSPKVANAFLSFLRRSSADKAIVAMGYVVGADADGFRYERTW